MAEESKGNQSERPSDEFGKAQELAGMGKATGMEHLVQGERRGMKEDHVKLPALLDHPVFPLLFQIP